jgi:hypothetical protein
MAITDITFGGGSPALSERVAAGAGTPKAISFDGNNVVAATGGGAAKVVVKQQLKQCYIAAGTASVLESRVS